MPSATRALGAATALQFEESCVSRADCDVLVMGNSVVGNLAAAWFTRYMPDLHVRVVGPAARSLPIVGESLVELSTQLLQEIGLGRHLVEEQLPKYGLTFYYKLAPTAPADPRYVVDAVATHPPLPAFLVNRFTLDDALRQLNHDNGVEHVDGKVVRVEPGSDARHRVTVRESEGTVRTHTARWVIDATGRRRLLARQLNLGDSAPHQRSAFWFRLADFDASLLDRIDAVANDARRPDAYYATHHFFGRGNWVWLIPVRAGQSGQMMSVGLTCRPDLFPEPVTSIPEFLDRMAREHPILGDLVRSGTVVDTNLYRNYMYRTRRRYSSRGWFLVGDAADTVDPLYSTGLALATMAIQQVGAIIRRDLAGSLTEGFVSNLDRAHAGFQRLGELQVARLYDVMQAGYPCRLRMHLHVVSFFHMALPLLLNGYHTDAVGAAMMARLGRPAQGLGRQLTDFEPLIARVAARQPSQSVRDGVRVHSAFAMNHSWFEHCRDDEIPRSLFRMFRHLVALRLGLMWTAGVRSWLDPVQLGGLLRSVIWGLAVGSLGRRSLKRSRLTRWLFASGPDDARPILGSSEPTRAELTR
jgi:flavin-dependent dehydrogenase